MQCAESKKAFRLLIENAVDFLNQAADGLEKNPKHSVIHFYTAVELLLKARLVREHWSLVVSIHPDWKKFLDGDFVSVSFEEICERLDKIVGSALSVTAKEKFNKIRIHRNKMVHFYHQAKMVDLPVRDVRSFRRVPSIRNMKTIEIAVEQFGAWRELQMLMTDVWRKEFSEWQNDFNEIEEKLKIYKPYLEQKFSSLKTEIAAMKKQGIVLRNCHSCSFKSAQDVSPVSGLVHTKCLVCGGEDKYLIFECPECGAKGELREGGAYKCEKCEAQFDEEALAEAINEDPATTDNYYDHPLPANCGCCDGYHTVVSYQEKYLCVSCLDCVDELYYCAWCNEANTGDMEDSHYQGCGHCDGWNGWHKDD